MVASSGGIVLICGKSSFINPCNELDLATSPVSGANSCGVPKESSQAVGEYSECGPPPALALKFPDATLGRRGCSRRFSSLAETLKEAADPAGRVVAGQDDADSIFDT